MANWGDPVKGDFKSHKETGESSKEYTGSLSSVRAKADMAGKTPTLNDQAAQLNQRMK
jgi:hypothetical protein